MSTVKLKDATETIKNLNAAATTLSSSTHVAGHSDGLYALINNLISDLSSIKASIKAEEKIISASITWIPSLSKNFVAGISLVFFLLLTLIEQSKRTQDNHCGSCNEGYYLQDNLTRYDYLFKYKIRRPNKVTNIR